MKVKTRELEGAALDWVVTKLEAERKRFTIYPEYISRHSTVWADGGPIIERERIEVRPYDKKKWIATDNLTNHTIGPTPLIAAMRCYVASKLDDEVDVPDELTTN